MWTIQVELLALHPIINYHRKAARCSDDKLLTFLVGVAAPFRAGGHVIQVISTSYRKRDMAFSFDEGKVSPTVSDLWQVENSSGVPSRGHLNPQWSSVVGLAKNTSVLLSCFSSLFSHQPKI